MRKGTDDKSDKYIELAALLEKIEEIKSWYGRNATVKAQTILEVIAAIAKNLDSFEFDAGFDSVPSPEQTPIGMCVKANPEDGVHCKIPERYKMNPERVAFDPEKGMEVPEMIAYLKRLEENVGNPFCIREPCEHRPWACSHCQFPIMKGEKDQ